MRRFAIVMLVWAALGGAPATSPPIWPAPEAELDATPPVFAADFGARRLFLDAGHGAENNPGNRSAFCLEEQAFSLDLANEVGRALEATGHFVVLVSRRDGELVPYPDRVRDAEAWGADAFVSLHSDVRGHPTPWTPSPDRNCLRSHDAPGFSILWSDAGESALVARRRAFAERFAGELANAGFFPFDGVDYRPVYAPDPSRAGSFVDRHAEPERIFVLWRPSMPSLIVETHNALDDREALRWNQPSTRLAFAHALARALIALLGR